MKKSLLIMVIGVMLIAAGGCFANLGDVTVKNENQSVLGSTDTVQFQLVTNGGGLVTSAVLPSLPPGNTQTLGAYSFSDQTNQFSVYIRDANATLNSYIPCAGPIPYQHNSTPIKILGWNDGKKNGCRIEN